MPGTLIAVLVLAHAFDYTSFLLMVKRHGLGAEANPVVVDIVNQSGLYGLTLVKIFVVALAGLIILAIGRRHARLAAGLLVFGVLAGLVGGLSNIATL